MASCSSSEGPSCPPEPPKSDSLYVSIASGSGSIQLDDDNHEIVLTLEIPNQLLYNWHRSYVPPTAYSDHVNDKIKGRVIKVKSCHRINERIRSQAAKIASRCQKLSGRKRSNLLQQSYKMSVLDGECESLDDIEDRVQQLEDGLAQKDEEITEILQEMAVLVAQEDTTLSDVTNIQSNSGKTIEEVSPRQARRKMKDVTTFSKKALWFAESFGLIPDYVQMHKAQSGSPVKVTICDESPSPSMSAPSESDYAKVRQILYILDRFAVSDEAYHELSVSSSLPPLYRLKEARSTINASLDLKRLQGDNPGAYRPLVDALKQEISKIMTDNPTAIKPDDPIRLKISGDGAKFSKSSNIILLSFSLPGLQQTALSGAGNHTFAAINAQENYNTLSRDMNDVMESINDLIATPEIVIYDETYTLDIIMGSDYKFLLMMLGLNQAHSTYSCIWCHIHRDKRYDMSLPADHYTKGSMKRTLSTLCACSALSSSSPVGKRLGSQCQPVLNIEPENVVIDELHLLLRIGDVLIRNLVFELVQTGRKDGNRIPTYLTQLSSCARECGVTFRAWECRDPYGKPSGKYDFTSLMGEDMKKIINFLPSHFNSLLRTEISDSMAHLWKDFYSLYKFVSSLEPPQSERIHTLAKDWITLFLSLGNKCQGFQKVNVTPYMHCLVYHVPNMIQKYGNIKQFSGQGVENNNNIAKRNYFSSNLHDVTGEVLKAEWRQEQTEKYKRQKRSYTKHNYDYWEKEINEARKRQRQQ